MPPAFILGIIPSHINCPVVLNKRAFEEGIVLVDFKKYCDWPGLGKREMPNVAAGLDGTALTAPERSY